VTKVPRLRTEIVKRGDDMRGIVVLPRRWGVERTFSWFWQCTMMMARKRGRFPLPRASGRCRFDRGTFAGASGNDEDAPTAVTPVGPPNRKGSTACRFPPETCSHSRDGNRLVDFVNHARCAATTHSASSRDYVQTIQVGIMQILENRGRYIR
jgi:hypothetical protein